MRSEEYWQRRAERRMDWAQRDARETLQTIDRAYRSASASMLVQIRAAIKAYGKRYGLTSKEVEEILRQPASDEMIEHLKKAVQKMEDGPQKNKMLAQINAPSARYRISGMQAIREQSQAVCSYLSGEEKRLFTDSLTESITETYNRTEYDIQKGVGFAWKTTGVSMHLIKQLLSEDWSGENYKTRITGRYEELSKELRTMMLEAFAGGRSQEVLREEMTARFGMNARAAKRLLTTETTYVVNAAEMERYKSDGVKEYVYIATLDLKTSDICQTLDGIVLPVAEAKAGKNYPPMHPNCRSTTGPVIDRRVLAHMTRNAQDPVTGEIITMPPGTTYRDWYKQMVDKHGKER